MLTKPGVAILFGGMALLSAGLAAGNPFWATLSLVPLGAFLVALAIEPPHGIEASMSATRLNPRQGEEVAIEVRYRIPSGVGAAELHVPLPDAFELKDGRNLLLVAKPMGAVAEGSFTFRVLCAKRGNHPIGPLKVESIHGPGVRAPALEDAAPALACEVRPHHVPVKGIRGMSGIARQMFPDSDAAAAGIATTEFRDVREYTAGDAVKNINWRASARQPGFHEGAALPMVNDYEREGKKSVWLYLDAAPYMQLGTNVQNSFEHAIEAASGIAQFYLDRGYKLGAYVYNSDRQGLLYPEVGRRQLLRWNRLVTKLQPGPDESEGFESAVDKTRRWLLEEKPLVVIVTRVGRADERFFLALKRLRAMTGRRRRRMPVLIVSTVAQAALPAPPEYAKSLVTLARRPERPLVARARRAGARVVEWDPSAARFESVLLKSAARRVR